MRPSYNKLSHKLKNLEMFQGKPDAVLQIIDDISYHYFVAEKHRPAHLWRMVQFGVSRFASITGLSVSQQDEAILKQLGKSERGENAATTEDDQKIVSLPAGHKTPVAFSAEWGTGFTIPGVSGSFIWQAQEETIEELPPDMGEVIEMLTQGARVMSGGAPIALEDKKLKKAVRKAIATHHLVIDAENHNSLVCACTEDFVAIDEWAYHVRKKVWRILVKSFQGSGEAASSSGGEEGDKS